VTNVATLTPDAVVGERRPAHAGDDAPPHAAALRTQARAAADRGRPVEAEQLFAECLRAYPRYAAARYELALLLLSQNRPLEALAETDRLLGDDDAHAGCLFLKGSVCLRLGDHEGAISLFSAALAADPGNARGWLNLGHALRAVGDLSEAVAGYRRALELAPHLGDGWWSLANLKTVRFSRSDLAAMQRSLDAMGLSPEDHVQLHYALGKAKEDDGDYAASFAHYAHGARLRRRALDYSPDQSSQLAARSKALLSADFFGGRDGQGCQATDPIFVVGLPRAGSTLVEQILSSHSLVEATNELPDIMALAARFGQGETPVAAQRYPEGLAELSAEQLGALGEAYLAGASVHRRERKPYFIDKMPNNFAYLGLIQLILPKARIIDVRRHPLGCGFSVFKQHFAYGQSYSYDLGEIGRYYADYVDLMAHMDRALPGRVHRVIYEALVADPEREVRRLLDYCGLPFEEACLRFHENSRAVRTPSSEQVRRPIYADATEHWRRFEPWLDPLKAVLGPVLEAYPAAPGEGSAAGSRRRRTKAR
jgi:tetratricopeptide (TPR) repeat protein